RRAVRHVAGADGRICRRRTRPLGPRGEILRRQGGLRPAGAALQSRHRDGYLSSDPNCFRGTAMDDKTRTELEAAAFRRLVDHLRTRTDVQNIDMMNLAGFCRNCLSNWIKEAADTKGVPMSKDQSREAIYGMPFEEWKAKYQKEASAEQM